jgi:hypothetical protein
MKRIQYKIASIVATLLITIFPVPLSAGDPIDVQWEQICYKAINHEIVITTTSGEDVEGYCISVDPSRVSVNVKGKAIQVARASVARLFLYPPRHQVRALGHGVLQGLRFGFGALLTPMGPSAAVAIPATLAWGAVSLPFCLLGDLRAKVEGGREVRTK